jgi:NADPH:quinone reductase-like Zn-dependent oxidoreductase
MDLSAETTSFLKEQEKTVFLDCVGGQFAASVFNSLSPNSIMVNYGRLSK